jgi:hypothetical protein
VRRFLYENSLSLFFFLLFVGALVGQALAGHAAYNQDAVAHHEGVISLGRYVASSGFANAVLENWQSEYLQFMLMMLATVWFLQKGSPESKPLDKEGRESDEDQRVGSHARENSPAWARARGWRQAVYSNSLLIVMGTIFLLSWFAQSVTGRNDYNDDQLTHHQSPVSWVAYLGSGHFWEQTLQNWQSEFLAVGSMAVLSIYLRQRGSPESKPVGTPHDATGVQG